MSRAQWTAGPKSGRMRDHALSSRFGSRRKTHSSYLSFTGQLHKRASLDWLRSGACRIRWVHRSAQGLRLAHQCHQHHIKRPQDKIWSCKIKSRSCHQASNMQDHSQNQWLFSLSDSIISIIRNTPVLADLGTLLGICQDILPDPRFCVYTKLWEFNPME